MPEYPDNRNKFKGLAPWEVPPANARFDNPKKYDGVVYSQPAVRGQAPRDAFRQTTAPPPPEPEPLPVAPHVEEVPDMDKTELGSISVMSADEKDKPEL